MRTIEEETTRGDFSRFDRLSEQGRAAIMETWARETWIKYRMRNSITEEEVFDAVFKIIEEDETSVSVIDNQPGKNG